VTGSSQADISAIFIKQVVPGGAGTSTANDGALAAVLLQ
jgi:hypothetical protein